MAELFSLIHKNQASDWENKPGARKPPVLITKSVSETFDKYTQIKTNLA